MDARKKMDWSPNELYYYEESIIKSHGSAKERLKSMALPTGESRVITADRLAETLKRAPRKRKITSSGNQGVPKDSKFWGIFIAIMVSAYTSALDLTAVATALPIVVEDLHGTQFVWVGSAYALAATAFLPASGGLAETFGRQPVLLGCLFLFALGSALCGAAPSMNFLIAGRSVQGLGSGGLISMTQTVVADMVPLSERGLFNSLIGVSWALAAISGPIIGGALSQAGQWRWLFYLNLFTTGISAILVVVFMRLKTPPGTLREKLRGIDYTGSFIVAAAAASTIIGLTWGGVEYSWSSPRVLVPLIVGFLGLVAFFFYEATYAKFPIAPTYLLSTRTGISGYIQACLGDLFLVACSFYIPVYFEACKGSSPINAGVKGLSIGIVSTIICIVSGVSVTKTKRYRPQLWFGWMVLIVGASLFSSLHADSPTIVSLIYAGILGIGIGIMLAITIFPVLSPLPITANAHALALFTFLRSFGRVWALTIGATVLQNYLTGHLPQDFLDQFPEGSEVAYGVIPLIKQLPQPLADEVRTAFAKGLSRFWQVMIGIGGLGLIGSAMMKHVPLQTVTDEKWGTQEDYVPLVTEELDFENEKRVSEIA